MPKEKDTADTKTTDDWNKTLLIFYHMDNLIKVSIQFLFFFFILEFNTNTLHIAWIVTGM